MHGQVSTKLSRSLDGRVGDDEPPDGWHIATDVAITFAPRQVLRPDLAGWRRSRVSYLPDEWPLTVLPDWVCEILSPNERGRDQVTKRRIYQEAGIPWYWLVDPDERVVTLLELTERGYLLRDTLTDADEAILPPFEPHVFALRAFFPTRPPTLPR